ncbi:MAG: nuclear transport factor 2 family protein [Erythrobacter sp.]|nr:nuclear transport factor 2 family protein [Erythrobacter sp.]
MRAPIVLAAIASLFAAPVAFAQASPQTVVQRHVDAYRAGDLERFVATFAPDATVIVNGEEIKGHSRIHAFYRSSFEAGPNTIRITESSMEQDRIFLTIAYDFGDGTERCCSYHEFLVVDGKIVWHEAVV